MSEQWRIIKPINQSGNYNIFVFPESSNGFRWTLVRYQRPLQPYFTNLSCIVSSHGWHFSCWVAPGWVWWTRTTTNCALRFDRENLLNPRPPTVRSEEGEGGMTPPTSAGSNYKRKCEVLRTICWEPGVHSN